MEQLPLDVHLEIFHYLSLNERVNCRFVSRSFKNSVEISLRGITHLILYQVSPGEGREFEEKMDESYIGERFLSKPFVEAHFKKKINFSKKIDLVFYVFLHQFCCNLQVLRMNQFNLTYGSLLHLPAKLQFFTCYDLIVSQSKLHRWPASLLSRFPNLEAFDTTCRHSKQGYLMDTFTKAQLSSLSPICEIHLPKEGTPDEETLHLLSRGGTKFLDVRSGLSVNASFSISHPLAETLVALSIEFVSTNEFCPFPLPNLQYLTMTKQVFPTSVDNCRKTLTPNLRSFTYKGTLNSRSLNR